MSYLNGYKAMGVLKKLREGIFDNINAIDNHDSFRLAQNFLTHHIFSVNFNPKNLLFITEEGFYQPYINNCVSYFGLEYVETY